MVTESESRDDQHQVQQRPFFLLDWLEDLIPEEHDPERLAELLRTPSKNKQSSARQELSPLQKLFVSWRSSSFKNSLKRTSSSKATQSMPNLQIIPSNTVSSVSSPTSCILPSMPQTPKSSNRRKCKKNWRMDDDVDDDDGSSSLPLPTRLESRLEDITLPSLDSTAAIKWQRRRQRRNLQKQTQSLFERSLWMAQCWTEKGLKAASTAVTDQDWQRALDCWDNALEIYQTLTPNHTQVANVQNNRGIALGKLKRSNLALQALYQALQIRQLELQEVRTTSSLLVVVSTLHNIANVQQEVGNLSEALRVLVQAKHTLWNTNTTTKEAENNGHKDDCSDRSKWHQSARLCVAMGHLYYQAEHWKDAKEAYNDAQAVYQQLLADDDGLRNEVLIQELWNVKADLKEVEEAQLLDASSLEPSLQPVQQQLDQLSFIIEP